MSPLVIGGFIAASFVWEIRGIVHSLKSDRSLVVHLPALVAAIFLGISLSASPGLRWVLIPTAAILFGAGQFLQLRSKEKPGV